MKIEYTENATGRHTEVLDHTDDGTPMASRFPGWLSKHEVVAFLQRARKRHDSDR